MAEKTWEACDLKKLRNAITNKISKENRVVFKLNTFKEFPLLEISNDDLKRAPAVSPPLV